MIINIGLRHIRYTKRIKNCFMCTKATTKKPPTEAENKTKEKKTKKSEKYYLQEAQNFLEANLKTRRYKDILPAEIQEKRPYKKPASIYLVCPDIAVEIAKHVCERVSTREVIAETSPGLGLISQELLKNDFKKVVLYERNVQFYKLLQARFGKSDKRVTLHNKDVFHLNKYAFLDKLDQETRVDSMFENLPKQSWSEDPFLTVIGAMTSMDFMKHLVKSIILQSSLTFYGRFDLFLLTYQNFYNTIEGKKSSSKVSWYYLFEMFFDVEYIDKFPRQYFLPWEKTKTTKKKPLFDLDNIYFIRVTMKKDVPIPSSEFIQFFCFLIYLYRSGTTSVIATCEKWLPDCGETLLVPKLNHPDYYDDLNVFTKFNKLTLPHTIALYKEFSNHPNFKNSPFMSMIENEWMKAETIETSLDEALSKKVKIVS